VKKFSGIIAMILILVMLAFSFTGCLTYWNFKTQPDPLSDPLRVVLFGVVDVIFLPVSLIALVVYLIITDASSETEYQTYLADAGSNIPVEYLLLMEKIYSLPDTELDSLKQILASMPEADRVTLLEKIYSFSETDRVSLVNAFTSLPETEIISSLERINSLSETERVSLLDEFKSLSEEEVTSLIEELQSLREERNTIASVDYSYKKEYLPLLLQY